MIVNKSVKNLPYKQTYINLLTNYKLQLINLI